jgi:hypothetical protein
VQYMLLIYAAEQGEDDPAILRRYGAFGQEVRDAGKFVAGDRLDASSTATLVRVQDGETLMTDGPFAETKEQLGGFYILDCESASTRRLRMPRRSLPPSTARSRCAR